MFAVPIVRPLGRLLLRTARVFAIPRPHDRSGHLPQPLRQLHRTQVYRWRQHGLSPERALRLLRKGKVESKSVSREMGLCSSRRCDDPAKVTHEGKPYCTECYKEIAGLSL
jgi:hypothetical protein